MMVVFTFFNGDKWLAKKNLEWMIELDGHVNYEAVLAADDTCDKADVIPLALKYFKRIHLFKYPRQTWKGAIIEKWPWQQNNSFAHVARLMPRWNQPWLWFETDCTPLKAGWIKTMENEYLKGGKPFGGHWNPETKIFNGVAIYPPNVAALAPKALTASMTVYEEKMHQNPWDAECSTQVQPQLHVMNGIMQHIWDLPDGKCPSFPDLDTVQKWVRPEVVIFHRCKDGTLIDRLREIKLNNLAVELHGPECTHTSLVTLDAILPPPQEKKVEVDLFMVTFERDLHYAAYSLQAVRKFVTGYNRCVVLVPSRVKARFEQITKFFPQVDLKTFEEIPGKGFVHHEAMVCCADQFCEAEYILHFDADCIFNQPVDVTEEYFREGKPILFRDRYDELPEEVRPWQVATEKALGWKPEYETMRRHPAVHPRWMYPKMRQTVEKNTGKPFLDYVLSCRNEFPQGFAEFPALGAWALQHAADSYCWIDGKHPERPVDCLTQFWSHGGLNMKWRDTGKTVLELIKEILAK